jgi:hypothetical protein
MKKWTIAVAAFLVGGYFTPVTIEAQQQGTSLACRDTCSTFASAIAGLSGAENTTEHSRSFESFIRSCRRLCAREGIFSVSVLEGVAESLSSLSSEEVRTLVVPAQPLPGPTSAHVNQSKGRITARALASRTPIARVTSTATAISTYAPPGGEGYWGLK